MNRLSKGGAKNISTQEARRRSSKTYNALPEVVEKKKRDEEKLNRRERVKKARETYSRKNKKSK